ncbi:unnamed protein product [Pylaiella littoralis]
MAEVSIEAAVEQLHQMFGDFDKSALAAVLEAHGGHVERTVEHLLGNPQHSSAGGGGSSGGGGSGGGGGGGGAAPGTDHDAALALQLSREWADDPTNAPPPPARPQGIPTPYGGGGGSGSGSGGRKGGVFLAERGSSTSQAGAGAAAASGGRGGGGVSGGGGNVRRGRRVALPEQFLRAPGWNAGGGEASSDPQVAADARLAMMLQNESFQRELQAHPDLAHLGDSRGGLFGGGDGPSIKEQMTSMGNDIRRKVDELAVRWKMKDPGRADETTEYSSVPLLDQHRDDPDDQAEVVHFSQNNTTRRSTSGGSAGGMGQFRGDAFGEEQQLGERCRQFWRVGSFPAAPARHMLLLFISPLIA